MNIFKSIKNLLTKTKEKERFLGVLGLGEELSTVHQFNEAVASASIPEFKAKQPSQWRKFPYQYQFSSSACVAYGTSKLCTILYFLKTDRIVKFSPAFFYTQRANKPSEGMVFSDIARLANTGALLYDLLPCEGMTEAQINSTKIEQYHRDAADAFAIPENWVEMPIDFETVASTIEKTGKGIKLWFQFGPNEFFGTQYPRVAGTNKPWGHDVTAIDAFTYDNKKYILIEDSADQENIYQKLIDRDFFQARCYLARYPINFKFDAAPINIKPVYTGSTASLQDCLTYEGVFPANVTSRGVYGSITIESVKKFQKKYGFEQTGQVGPKTTAKLKELYS